MTIHSIIPMELIMADADETSYSFDDVTIDGIAMQIEYLDQAMARIVRLYSVNPNDYLNPNYSPGTVIHYAPVLGRK